MSVTSDLSPGTRIVVREHYPPGHVRTPVYVRGQSGVITRKIGDFGNPETLALGQDGLPLKALYEVKFKQKDLWPDYAGADDDSLLIDLYENWISKA